jgi:hypothetical protein
MMLAIDFHVMADHQSIKHVSTSCVVKRNFSFFKVGGTTGCSHGSSETSGSSHSCFVRHRAAMSIVTSHKNKNEFTSIAVAKTRELLIN